MLTKCLNITWDEAFSLLMVRAYEMADMPSSNAVIVSVLLDHGFKEHSLMSKCKNCYTIEQFCKDHPHVIYAVFVDNHTCAVVDGVIHDIFDSSQLVPIYYFSKDGGDVNE